MIQKGRGCMFDLVRNSAWDGIALPSHNAVKFFAENLPLARLRLPPGAPTDALPGPRQAAGGWLNIGPLDWLYCGANCARADTMDVSDALVSLRIEGEGAVDLLDKSVCVDWETFGSGSCARMRLGEIGVILHRDGEQTFRLIFAAPYVRYLTGWLAHHV
jgi:hypothetical protein